MMPAIAPAAPRVVGIHEIDVCAICGEICVPHRCSWPVEKETRIPIIGIERGDRVQVAPGVFHFVEYVSRSQDGKTVFYKLLGLQAKTFQATDTFMPSVNGLRKAACGAVCCDNCAREVDDNRHYCRDHWNAWESVS